MSGSRNRFYGDLIVEILKTTQKPMTAYTLLDALKIAGIKAPQTVYRALNQLLDEGKIHRLDSLNAYVLCQQRGHVHPSVFFICNACGLVWEEDSPALQTVIQQLATVQNFTCLHSTLEIKGHCADCQKKQARAIPD